MRRLAVFLLTAAALGAAAAPAVAAPLGVAADDGFVAAKTANVTTLGTELGRLTVTWVRVDVRWNAIAPTQPKNPRVATDPGYDWSAVDAAVTAARAVTLPQIAPPGPPQLLFSIGGTPDWARADGGAGGSPGDPAWAPRRAAFRNFVAAVAARYAKADGVPIGAVAAAFEIWPSPNSATALRPQRDAGRLIAPALFKSLVKNATAEIRKVSTVPVVTGGLARTDPANTADTGSAVFLKAMGRSRTAADAIGMRLQPPTGVESVGDTVNLSLADPAGIVTQVDAAFPNQGKPIWVTGYALSGDQAATGVSTLLGAAGNARFGLAIWNTLVNTTANPGSGLYDATTLAAPTAAGTAWITAVTPPPG